MRCISYMRIYTFHKNPSEYVVASSGYAAMMYSVCRGPYGWDKPGIC